ncbi:AmmeMemoRadiSam system protein B [Enhygromyxa salina]|uniref:AmmeMemoRadiSam system protein B n=1 Tax=Enhygromyxa salina TaxID=215803 RepID=UPI0006985673
MPDDERARAPAVAGRFYPREPTELAGALAQLMAGVGSPAPRHAAKGIIAPHAGYVYSGPVAATAYASLAARAQLIEKVVLLGPAHRVYVRGLALPAASWFATPLGEVEIDPTLAARALELACVQRSAQAHALEHSLEVHIPFLQTLLPHFTLLPLVVGDASPQQVAAVLERCWGGPETAIVISSDLSHYHSYAEAARLDRATASWITSANTPGLDPQRACGARCIDGLIALGQQRRLDIELLDLRSSGDTAGSRDQVVGYGAFAIHESQPSS